MPLDQDKAKARSKRYRDKNKQEWVERSTSWNNRNPESRKRSRDKYRKKHKARVQASNKARYARKMQAMPKWANEQKDLIEALYVEAQRLTSETGIPHQVDHIVPLRGKNVSGLHCHENLQVITAEANRRKGNKHAS